jgi:flagellar basal-body rod modification protein FlgD
MGATTLGILNHVSTSGQLHSGAISLNRPVPNAAGNEQASVSTATAATISANDFLTLLVTEMRNQDPTANTDPNEYVNQLVQVNSLEQLISINQTLIADSGGSPGNSAATNSGTSIHRSASEAAPAHIGAPMPAAQAASSTTSTSAARTAFGNLSIPGQNPSAQRVAQALGGVHSAI